MSSVIPSSDRLRPAAFVVVLLAAGALLAGSAVAAQPGGEAGSVAASAESLLDGSAAAASPASGSSLTVGVDALDVASPLEAGALRIDYAPSPQTVHVGLYSVLTILTGALGYWIASTRRTRGGRIFAATLLVTALRTAVDALHVIVGDLWAFQSALVASTVALQLLALSMFCWFAARYSGDFLPDGRRVRRALGAFLGVVTVVLATNPVHTLVVDDFVHLSSPFAHVGVQPGPLWWGLLALQTVLLLAGAGLLSYSFTVTENPSWWAAGTLAMAICFALVVTGLSALGGGPLPWWDYTGVALAGFAIVTAIPLLGHGLRRIEFSARETVLREMDDAIAVLDDTGTVVDANAAADRLLPDLAVGDPFADAFVRPLPMPDGDGTETTEVSSDDFRSSATDDPTTRRHYLVQATAVTTATADTLGYTVRFVDVSTLRERTIELEKQRNRLDQFASTVSDGLRNPLTVATGYVDLLLDAARAGARGEPIDRESFGSQLTHVATALDRMNVIIEDILTLARGSDSVTETQYKRYSATVEAAWANVDGADATLSVAADGVLEADHDRLQRLLENLFRNAVEHGSTSPRSQTREEPPEHDVATDGSDVFEFPLAWDDEADAAAVSIVTGVTAAGFYVADDGPGIPAAERDRVFEHGYTGDSSGTGLGLSIVLELAEAHGWTIDVRESAAGGARFEVTGCVVEAASDEPVLEER